MAPGGQLAAGAGPPPDIHHEQLIGLIDELRLMILSRGDPDLIEDAFEELNEIAVGEFAREEQAMRAIELSDRQSHVRRHAELTRNLRTLRHRFSAAPDQPQRDELYDFLSDLLVHTLLED
jgi:hemerythrin-like metal-binding protein